MIRRIFRNRWVRGTTVTLVILLTVVTLISLNGYYSVRHRGEQHQAQVLAELDATDPGWRFDQMQAARQVALPPLEKNVIEQAMKLAERFPEQQYREWQSKHPPPPDPTPPPNALPTADDVAYSRRLVELCRELIPEARELRHLSGGVVLPQSENPVFITLPHVDKASRVETLLRNDATVSAADGKIDDALDDALAVLALARGFDGDPYLSVQLFRLRFLASAARVVERTLRQGEATDAKLAEVQAAFAAAVMVRGFVAGLRGERAGMSKLADLLEKDPGQADGLIADGGTRPPKAAVAVVASALLPETHARYLELMTRAIAIAEKPAGPDRNAEFAQIDADLKADTSLEGEALRLVFPAIIKCYDADVRMVALLDAAVAVLWAERYRLKEGSFPIAQSGQPTDPYTGKSLLFKRFDDGIAVYSTGPDGKDDGGENVTDGATKPGFDWGVRLYDGKHRKR